MGSTASRRDVQLPTSILYLLDSSAVKDGRASATPWWYWVAIFIPLGLGIAGITIAAMMIVNCVKKRKLRKKKSFENFKKRISQRGREDVDSSDYQLR